MDDLSVSFTPGFNVITGASGSGKSLLVRARPPGANPGCGSPSPAGQMDAISQVCGAPVLDEHVRAPASVALLEATFHVGASHSAAVTALLQDTGLADTDEKVLVLRRELQAVAAEGTAPAGTRSACRVNGRPVPLRMLRALGSMLVDINGQGAAASLGAEEGGRGGVMPLLDARAGLASASTRFAAALVCARTTAAEAEAVASRAPTSEEEAEQLAALVEEVDAANPEAGEDELLRRTLRRLEARRAASEACGRAGEALSGGALDALKSAQREAKAVLNRLPPPEEEEAAEEEDGAALALTEALELCAAAAQAVRDAQSRLADAEASLAADAAARDSAATRLRVLEKLCRKHGARDVEALLAASEEASSRLAEADGSEERLAALQSSLRRALEEMAHTGAELGAARASAARALEAEVDASLAALGMAGARMRVALRWDEAEAGAEEGPGALRVPAAAAAGQDASLLYSPAGWGLDRAQMLFSPAPGEPLRPLAAVASGGERARVMLALKSALSSAGPPVSLFDEADSGVGGAAGAAVGAALRRLAREGGQQVLCVTHLPQVAAFAERHLLVRKEVGGASDGRSVSRAAPLGSRAERAAALAEMLALGAEAGEQLLQQASASEVAQAR